MSIHRYPDKIHTVHLSFNKLTGARFGQLIGGRSAPSEDNQHLVWKTENFNPNTHTYHGDYESGSVVRKEDVKPEISEFLLNTQCATKIEKQAPVHRQINAMSLMLEALIEKGVLTAEDPGVTDFLDYREYIERAQKNNALYKEARAASEHEVYVSKEEKLERVNNQLAGGLNIIVGRGEV